MALDEAQVQVEIEIAEDKLNDDIQASLFPGWKLGLGGNHSTTFISARRNAKYRQKLTEIYISIFETGTTKNIFMISA